MLCSSDGRYNTIYKNDVGGGPKNAYTAGVINAIVKHIPIKERAYDVVVGNFISFFDFLATSYAAINAVILAMFPIGQEVEAANAIKAIWEALEDSMLFQSWDWWYIEGLLYKGGLYDTSPSDNTIMELLARFVNGFQRRVVIGTTDINTGTYLTFDETVDRPRLVQYLKAAISHSGFHVPVYHEGRTLMEGGIVLQADITQAIEECRIHTDDENIVIDVIMVQQGKII